MRYPDPTEIGVIPLPDVAWPLTYRFLTSHSWGTGCLTLTVDAPDAYGDLTTSLELGRVLWQRAVAPTTSAGVVLLGWDTVMWRTAPAGLPSPDGFSRGLLAGAPAARTESASCLLRTSREDGLAYREVVIPGIPASWSSFGVLTRNAQDALEQWGGMMLMGLCKALTGAPLQWLVEHRDLLEPTADNPRGVAFRRVEHVYGMHHTRRAPVYTGAPWP